MLRKSICRTRGRGSLFCLDTALQSTKRSAFFHADRIRNLHSAERAPAGNTAAGAPHAALRRAVHDLSGRGGAVQHGRSGVHCERARLGQRRQRSNDGRLSADGRGAGDCGHARRRLLRVCQPDAWRRETGGCPPRRRRNGNGQCPRGACPDGGIPAVPGHAADVVRRARQCRDIREGAGIFLLDCLGRAAVRLWAGNEPGHPFRRQPDIRNGCHTGRCGGKPRA